MKTINEHRKDATLDKSFNFGEDGILTRREWLKLKMAQGWTATHNQERNYAAEEKLSTWIKDNAWSHPWGNSNHPQTIAYNAEKERLKNGIYKDVYRLESGNGVYLITKTEYDYFLSLNQTLKRCFLRKSTPASSY